MRWIDNPRFGAVIFRRTFPQIRNEGALWDASGQIYPYLGAVPRESTLEWRFPSGARIRFAHMEHEDDKLAWQGSEVPYIGFDESTHFSEGQFFYMLSRNRSTCGVRPYMRATTNPDALSWVKGFLAPWLDREFAEPAASGELRWFIRDGGQILWVPRGTEDAKSVTFVRASIFDNRILMQKDPAYLANLKALPPLERARLLEGDWDIVEAGDMFDRDWFDIIPWTEVPADCAWVRFWDMAGSKPKPGYTDPDWTSGCLMGMDKRRTIYIGDMESLRETPGKVEARILSIANSDRASFGRVPILMEQEPGSLSLFALEHFARLLIGFEFTGKTAKGSKKERAKPLSSYAQKRLVKIVSGPWNHRFLNLAAAFPTVGVHDDEIDSASGAFEYHGSPREAQFSDEDHAAIFGGRS